MNDITTQAILAAAAAEDAAQSVPHAVQPYGTGAPEQAAPVATGEGPALAPEAVLPAPTHVPEPVPARTSGVARRRKAQDDEASDADRAQADESAAGGAGAASGAASGAAAGDWGPLPAATDLLAQAAVPSTAAAAPTSAGTNAPDATPPGPSLVDVLLGAVPLAVVAAAAGSDSDPAPAPAAPDTTPPRVSIDAPARSVSATPTITGTTDLADGATVAITLQRADGSTADYTVKVQGGQYSLPVPAALPEGSFTVTATAVDAAGNRATASDTGTVDLMTIDGTITAGPVVDGHGLTVTAYAADGSVLGHSPVAADGSYRIVLQQPYAGLMLVRVSDHDPAEGEPNKDYRDEASGQPQDLTVDLRAVAQADGSQDLRVNVTPATELVVLGLGLASGDGGGAAARLGQVSTAQLSAAQGAVQSALGLPDDFVSATVVPTVLTDGSANAQANVYGQVLAAISGLSVTQGQQVGSVLAALQPEVGDGSVGRAAAIGLVGAAVVANASGTAVGSALGLSSADATAITSAWSAVVGATRTDGVAPSDADLAVLGVASPGTPQALALVVSAIQGSTEAQVGNVAALSALAGAAANVVAAADGDGELAVKDLQALGVEGVTEDNLDAVAHALVTLGVQQLPTNVEALAEVVQTVVQDTSGPTLIVAATLGTDSGLTATVAPGGTTRDSTVVVSGSVSDASGVAGVQVFDGATLLGTAAVATDGSWRFTTPALGHGIHAINVQATDLMGNVSTSPSIAFTVDTEAPTVSVSAAALTNDTTPTISGTTTGLASGATVSVEVLDAAGAVVQTHTATVGADGRYTADAATPGDGAYTVRVNASDAAGNAATAATASVRVDTAAPVLVSNDVVVTDTGATASIVSGGLTKDDTVTVSGTVADAVGVARVQVYDGSTLLGTADISADGRWSFNTGRLPQGDHSITAVATDTAGNASPASTPLTFSVDTESPTVTVSTAAFTRDATPAISGGTTGLAAGATVTIEVLNGSGAVVQTLRPTVGADGRYTVDAAALADGAYTVRVNASDAAGNAATAATASIELDATPPTVTVNAATLTRDTTPTISGSTTGLAAGTTVTIEVVNAAGAVVQTLTPAVGADGRYSVDAAALTDDVYTVRVSASDAAGNAATTATASVEVDTEAPTVTVSAAELTRDTTPTISGSTTGLAAGTTVTIEVVNAAGAVVQTLTPAVGADGRYSVDAAALADGAYTVRVSASDAAGNPATTATASIEVDTEAPTVTVSAAALTNDTTPTIGGSTTGLAAGAAVTVEVLDAAGEVVQSFTAEVDAQGDYAVDAPGLADGVYTVRASASDAAGNPATSDPASIVIDNAAPRITSGLSATANEGQAVLYRATAADEAFNNHGVTWTLGGTDAELLFIDDAGVVTLRDGLLEFDGAGSQRTYRFTVIADDGLQTTESSPVTVTVDNLDDEAPTLTAFAAPVAVAAADNAAVVVTLAQLLAQGDEADDVAVTGFRVVAVNAGGTLKIGTDAASAQDYRPGDNDTIDATRHAFWLPAEGGALGNRDAFSVQALDAANATSAASAQVQVQLVAPFSISFTDALAVAPENAATVVATAGAGAGAVGRITWTKEGADADGFDIDPDTGALTLRAQNYEQPADQGGDRHYQVTVRATDIRGVSATATYAVDLTDANDAATFGGDLAGEVTEGAGATVADGLTVTGRTATVEDEDAGDADGFQPGDYAGRFGTLTMQADGQWRYVVDRDLATIDALPAGGSTTDSIVVRSADNTPRTIVVTLHGANDTPVAVNDGNAAAPFATVAEDSGFTVIDVLANDTDAEGSAALVVASASSEHGTVTIADDGKSISFRPTAHYFGPATINYTVRDAQGAVSAPATVTVDVTAVIDPAIVESSVSVGGDLFINDADDNAATIAVTGRIAGTAGSDFTVGQAVRVTTGDGLTSFGEVLDADGNFSVAVASTRLTFLAEGAEPAIDRELVVALMNADGTTVATQLNVPYIVDIQAPSAALVSATTTDGAVESDDITARDTVTFTFSGVDFDGGTGVNGVQVYNHGALLGAATYRAATGQWQYVSSGLTTGDYSITAVATDMAGNRSEPSPTFTFSVDRTGPQTAASDTASLYENTSLLYVAYNTDDAGDPVTWSLVPDTGDAGRLVLADRIQDGVVVGKAVRVAAGEVDYDNTADFQTAYTFTLRGVDALGNTTDKTVTIHVLDAAEFTLGEVTVGNDANPIVNAADLGDAYVTVTARLSGEYSGLGTGTAGDPTFILSVGPEDQELTGDAAQYTFDAATGIVTFTQVPKALIQGNTVLTVRATVQVNHADGRLDRTFSSDPDAVEHPYTVDTSAPTLFVTRFNDADEVNLHAATGGDAIIHRDSLYVAGNVAFRDEAVSAVLVYLDDTLVRTVVPDSTMLTWNASLSGLTAGGHTLRVERVDSAGNAAPVYSRSFTYVPDTAAPVITSAASADVVENAPFSHALTATDLTRVSWQVREDVAGQQGSLFAVDANNHLVLKAGTPDYELSSTYTVTVRATDTSGNFIDQTITFNVRNVVEATSITSVAVTDAANVINLAEAARAGTPGATLTVSGQVTGEYRADDVVEVVANGNTYTGTVQAGGSFTVAVDAADLVASTVPDGAGGTTPGVTVTVQATSSDGGVVPVSLPQTFSFDTTVPTVTLDGLPDTVATRTMVVAGTVTGAAAGATVTVEVLNSANAVVATGTGSVAAGTGRFSADIAGLTGGDYTVVAHVANPAGNVGHSVPEPFAYSAFFIEATGPYGFATTMDENVAGYGVVLSTRSDAVGEAPTLAIVGGADSGLFELVDVGGAQTLRFRADAFGSAGAAPDFDAFADANGDNTFEVVVQATDAEEQDVQQTITLTLTNRGPGLALFPVNRETGEPVDLPMLSASTRSGTADFTIHVPGASPDALAWDDVRNVAAGWQDKADGDFPVVRELDYATWALTGTVNSSDAQGADEPLLQLTLDKLGDTHPVLNVSLNADAWAYRGLAAGETLLQHVDLWMRQQGGDAAHVGEVSRARSTWTLVGVNDAPEVARTATDSVATGVRENDASAVTLTYAALLAAVGATDVDGDDELAALRVVSVGLGTLRVDGTDYAAGSALPDNLRITAASTVQWTPGAGNDANGLLTAFTVQAVDTAGLASAAAAVRVDVAADNDAPRAADDTASGAANAPQLTGNVITGRDGVGVDTDVEDATDALRVAGVRFGEGASAVNASPGEVLTGAYGTLTLGADGGYLYVPGPAAAALPHGQQRTDVFTYTVADGNGGGLTDEATLSITVTGVNHNPVANDDLNTTQEVASPWSPTPVEGNVILGAPGTGDVADTDSIDGDTLTVLEIAAIHDESTSTSGTVNEVGSTEPERVQGTYGWLTMYADGRYTYELDNANPTVNALNTTSTALEDVFEYTVGDGHEGSATARLTIRIDGADDAPVVTGTYTGALTETAAPSAGLHTSGTFTLSDPDNATPTLDTTRPYEGTYGALTLTRQAATATYDWTYTLNANADTLAAGVTAPDVITLTLSSGETLNVTIEVTGVDDTMVVTGASGAVTEDTASTGGTLVAFDPDAPPGSEPTIVAGSQTTRYGTFSIAANGEWTYTLDSRAQALTSGTFDDSVDVDIGHGRSQTIALTVTGVNDAPITVAVPAAISGTEDTVVNLTFADLISQLSASDVDGTLSRFTVGAVTTGTLRIGATAETATAFNASTNATIDATHSAFWTPGANNNGSRNMFTVRAVDNDGATSSSLVQLRATLAAVNDAPSMSLVNWDDYSSTPYDPTDPSIAGNPVAYLMSAGAFPSDPENNPITRIKIVVTSGLDSANDRLEITSTYIDGSIPNLSVSDNLVVTQYDPDATVNAVGPGELILTAKAGVSITNSTWSELLQLVVMRSQPGAPAGDRVFAIEVTDAPGGTLTPLTTVVTSHAGSPFVVTVAASEAAPALEEPAMAAAEGVAQPDPTAAQPSSDEAGASITTDGSSASGAGTGIDDLLAALTAADTSPSSTPVPDPGSEAVYPDPFHYWRTPDSALLMV